MKKSLTTIVALAACSGMGVGGLVGVARAGNPPTVELRIVERTGQTFATSAGDHVLDFAVQARALNGATGNSVAGYGFDIVITGEPDTNGTLAKGLTSAVDHTYSPMFAVNAAVGTGGLPWAYTFLAGISGVFNGNVNANGGSFTNTPGNQEIGLVTGSIGGSSIFGVPGIDPMSEGNIATWSGYGVGGTPTNGDTASVDSAVGNVYFGTGGNYVDVYRFRYTPTVFTGRHLSLTLANVGAQVFDHFAFSNNQWGVMSVSLAPSAITATGLMIDVGTQGACCETSSGNCTAGLDANCGAGTTFIAAGVCSPNPCPQPSGRCCNTDTGACTFITQAACTGNATWTTGGSCSPNTCTQPSGRCCNDTTATCTITLMAACTNGSSWTVAGTCTPNTCPLPNGTCCSTSTGGCTFVMQANCPGGSNWTIGGTCSPNTCPGPQGVCCNFITGSCSITTQGACGLGSHTWEQGGTCSPNTCPVSGSCCDSSGGCVRLTQSRCTGTWTSGQVCNPNPCPTTGRCCNFITASCVITLQADCPTASKVWSSGGTCTPNTCPPTGSCCVSGACSRLTQSRCTGTWASGGVCNPTPCTTNGRCCNFITGSCVITLQPDCPTASKVWTVGGTCTPNTCPAPGACCTTADGSCRRLTQAMCTGGTTWIASTVCSPNPCPQPNGVCCNFVSGSCAITLQADCGTGAHTWGAGGSCTPNTCPEPGACCFSGTCRRLTQSQCTIQNGFFLIKGTCSPTNNPCAIDLVDTKCRADFNRSGKADSQDVFDFLNAWFVRDVRADIDGSGTVETQDIFEFLNTWLAGCAG